MGGTDCQRTSPEDGPASRGQLLGPGGSVRERRERRLKVVGAYLKLVLKVIRRNTSAQRWLKVLAIHPDG